jgi:DNA-binding response OmpR family regulator
MYERRGALIGREELLRNVWGKRYDGGARTVDIHLRRSGGEAGSRLVRDHLRDRNKLRRQR